MGLYLLPLHATRNKHRHASTVHPHISTRYPQNVALFRRQGCPPDFEMWRRPGTTPIVVILSEAKNLHLSAENIHSQRATKGSELRTCANGALPCGSAPVHAILSSWLSAPSPPARSIATTGSASAKTQSSAPTALTASMASSTSTTAPPSSPSTAITSGWSSSTATPSASARSNCPRAAGNRRSTTPKSSRAASCAKKPASSPAA